MFTPIMGVRQTLHLPFGMPRFLACRATFTALAILAAACAGAPQTPALPDQNVTAFVDVMVVPLDRDRVVERQTVVVRGDRIAAMGPTSSTPVPAGATRIDGRDKY